MSNALNWSFGRHVEPMTTRTQNAFDVLEFRPSTTSRLFLALVVHGPSGVEVAHLRELEKLASGVRWSGSGGSLLEYLGNLRAAIREDPKLRDDYKSAQSDSLVSAGGLALTVENCVLAFRIGRFRLYRGVGVVLREETALAEMKEDGTAFDTDRAKIFQAIATRAWPRDEITESDMVSSSPREEGFTLLHCNPMYPGSREGTLIQVWCGWNP